MALYYRGRHCRQLVGQRQGVVLQGKEGIDEAYQIPEWEQCVWLYEQREPLYAFCGSEARISAQRRIVGKTGIMARWLMLRYQVRDSEYGSITEGATVLLQVGD